MQHSTTADENLAPVLQTIKGNMKNRIMIQNVIHQKAKQTSNHVYPIATHITATIAGDMRRNELAPL